MRNDSVEEILAGSNKAEMLEDFTKALETATRVVIMVEERQAMDDGKLGSHTFYFLLGFRQLYEVDGFIKQLHQTIMEGD